MTKGRLAVRPFCSATALPRSAALPFVIPSGAEGSAVQRTFLGNVFQPSEAEWRSLRFLFRLKVDDLFGAEGAG
jgi:hypothetical protein